MAFQIANKMFSTKGYVLAVILYFSLSTLTAFIS